MAHIGADGIPAIRKESEMATPEAIVTATDFLNEAAKTVGDRGRVYADPATNHLRIAHLWSTYLETAIEPLQVAICMALVKIARSMETPDHVDSYVDGAAYLAIAGQLGTLDWNTFGNY